ncbi:hypothetical protein MHEI_31610 [Mycobacterium heidelbergense]|nr:hypothetical protein MHEI_31610 [Mycobacterium heidelbergense]
MHADSDPDGCFDGVATAATPGVDVPWRRAAGSRHGFSLTGEPGRPIARDLGWCAIAARPQVAGADIPEHHPTEVEHTGPTTRRDATE